VGALTGRPVLLVITGAFAGPGTLDHLQRVFQTVDVLGTHVPGNHCPLLKAVSVDAHAAALSDALGQAVPDARLGVLGLSLGALVALGIRAPNLRSLVLVEPPLFTTPLWHLAESGEAPPGSPVAALLWEVFGIRDGEVVEPWDHSALLTGLAVPAEVLIGDVPAEPRRPMEKAPSFVDLAARALLDAHPLVRTVVAPGAGHNLPVQAPMVLYDALVRMVADLEQSAATAR
jgi:pimeloyl-ACP methyl ester carboxylesterase